MELREITLNGSGRPRLNGISLRITARRTAIVGYSGAGKTSLLNVLAGFEVPDKGEVRISGEHADESPGVPATETRLPMYWVPQNGGLWPHLTARQHLQVVAEEKLADKLLSELDLSDRRDAFPGELSQGERGRLSLARGMAARPLLLLMDEPLSHVDPVRKPGYWRILRQFAGENGTSMIFASHDPDMVRTHADSVVCLHEGSILAAGPTVELTDRPPCRLAAELLGRLDWQSSVQCDDRTRVHREDSGA